MKYLSKNLFTLLFAVLTAFVGLQTHATQLNQPQARAVVNATANNWPAPDQPYTEDDVYGQARNSRNYHNHCSKIKTIRTWSQGNDAHGVRVELQSNPSQCPYGYYIVHNANNKNLVYSSLLSAKMADQKICVQAYLKEMLANLCRLNYTYQE